MSTYLEDGKILVKIKSRFMVFTANGAFIDEVVFDDGAAPKTDDGVINSERSS
jgi:hypothetical protein